NVLAEIPRDWQKALGRWKLWNKRHRTRGEGSARSEDAPDRNDEDLLYQTLIGAWPIGAGVRSQGSGARSQESGVRSQDTRLERKQAVSLLTSDRCPVTPDSCLLTPGFVERICQYMEKAVREAKVHSSWINPDPAYDDAVRRFVTRIL